MARKRMIDPEIFDSAEGKNWSSNDFLVMVASICTADDEGRGRIAQIKKNVIAMISDKSFQKSLRKLNDSIVIYQKIYFFLPKFRKYQYLNKPKPSKFPEPNYDDYNSLPLDSDENSPNEFPKNSHLIELNRIELNREGKQFPALADVLNFFLEEKNTEQEANTFYNYYATRNWRVSGEDIVDWKAAAKAWMLREHKFEKKSGDNGKTTPVSTSYSPVDQSYKKVLDKADEEIKKHGKFKGFGKVEVDDENKDYEGLPI